MTTLTLPIYITKKQLAEVLPQHAANHKDAKLDITQGKDSKYASLKYKDIAPGAWQLGDDEPVVKVEVTKEPHESTPGRFVGTIVGHDQGVITGFDFHIRTALDHFYPDWRM